MYSILSGVCTILSCMYPIVSLSYSIVCVSYPIVQLSFFIVSVFCPIVYLVKVKVAVTVELTFTYISVQLVEPGYASATSSSVHGNFLASSTIDGNTNQNISNCSHTDTGKPKAWLRVDLHKNFNIQSVKFWYRNDSAYFICIKLSFLSFSFHVTIYMKNNCHYEGNPSVYVSKTQTCDRLGWSYERDRKLNFHCQNNFFSKISIIYLTFSASFQQL